MQEGQSAHIYGSIARLFRFSRYALQLNLLECLTLLPPPGLPSSCHSIDGPLVLRLWPRSAGFASSSDSEAEESGASSAGATCQPGGTSSSKRVS